MVFSDVGDDVGMQPTLLGVGFSILVTVCVNNDPQVAAGMVITLLTFAFRQRYVLHIDGSRIEGVIAP